MMSSPQNDELSAQYLTKEIFRLRLGNSWYAASKVQSGKPTTVKKIGPCRCDEALIFPRKHKSFLRRDTTAVDIRNIFRAISDQLQADFRRTSEVVHSGGKGGLREDALGKFFLDYLPKRHAVGRGEVITPENQTSGQLDIVIYDDTRCPVLVPSTAHAVYPIESVFGAISVKCRLNSTELKDAYAKYTVIQRDFAAGEFRPLSLRERFCRGNELSNAGNRCNCLCLR
jgi:hypothetical protein